MSEPPSGGALVLGLGNPIMGDDGLGLAALERLRQEWQVPPDVRPVDGGTWGMRLLPLIEQADAVLFLDAIDGGRGPGQLIHLGREALPRGLGHKLSSHQVDLREVLAVLALRERMPRLIAAIGLQPARIELSTSLSAEVAGGLGTMVGAALAQLTAWGYRVQAAAAAVRRVSRLRTAPAASCGREFARLRLSPTPPGVEFQR